MRLGIASRQACVASATATSNAPVAISRSPVATPMTRAGTPTAAAAPQIAAVSCGFHAAHDDRRRFREARLRGRAAVEVELDPHSDLARDRHLRERDRETAVAHVVHSAEHAVAHETRDQLVDGPGPLEIRLRWHPAVEPVHDRSPLRTAQVRPHRPQHHDVVARAHDGRGRAVAQIIDETEDTGDRRGVDVVVPDAL